MVCPGLRQDTSTVRVSYMLPAPNDLGKPPKTIVSDLCSQEIMFPFVSRLSTSSSEYLTSPAKTSTQYKDEGTIVVKPHSGWTLFRHWIHIAAIVVTAGLAAINILNIFLMDSNHPNSVLILNAFQFAAKTHEVLIVGSLMLVMMDSVRSRLISSTGVPFGFLLSPILFNDLDWLFNHHFWSAMKPTKSSFPLAALIFVSIPFANIAGPLSAISVIPRLGWSAPRIAQVNPTFFNSSAVDIFPTTLAASSLLPRCFTGPADTGGGSNACPPSSVKTVSIVFDPVFEGFLCTTTGKAVSCNASMDFRDFAIEYDSNSLTAYSTTPTPVLYEVLSSKVSSGFAVQLNISDTETIDARKEQLIETRFLGNREMLRPISKVVCQDLSYAQIYQTFQDFGVVTNWSTPFAHWLAGVGNSPGPHFLFTYLRDDPLLDARTPCEGEGCYAATSCTIDARWAPIRFFHNTAQSSVLYHSDPQPAKLFESKAINDAIPVVMKKDWLEAFTSPQAGVGGTNVSKVFPKLLDDLGTPMVGVAEDRTGQPSSIENFQPCNFSQAISVFVSSIITEALGSSSSLVGDSIYNGNCTNTRPGFKFSPAICNEDPSFWVHAEDLGELDKDFSMIAFTVRRYGWGWFIDSLTVKIAIGILVLHGVLTLLYLIASLAFRRKITTCWASAPQMLMLAVDSLRAPVLMGSSASASHRELWREPVSVMEVDGGERVSLIVGDPLSYPDRLGGPPILGKKYN